MPNEEGETHLKNNIGLKAPKYLVTNGENDMCHAYDS